VTDPTRYFNFEIGSKRYVFLSNKHHSAATVGE
jgi:hypothetical protein